MKGWFRTTGIIIALHATAALAGCGSDGTGPPGNNGGGQQVGTVTGTVTEQGAGGLGGVAVSLERTGETARNATTAANGTFTITGVPTGTWNVTVTPPTGYTIAGAPPGSITVTANQTTTIPAITLAPPPASMNATVDMRDDFFTPATARVLVGGTVTWTNRGNNQHNTTSTGNWASPNLNTNGTFAREFNTVGEFDYECTLHAGMNGTVIVQ